MCQYVLYESVCVCRGNIIHLSVRLIILLTFTPILLYSIYIDIEAHTKVGVDHQAVTLIIKYTHDSFLYLEISFILSSLFTSCPIICYLNAPFGILFLLLKLFFKLKHLQNCSLHLSSTVLIHIVGTHLRNVHKKKTHNMLGSSLVNFNIPDTGSSSNIELICWLRAPHLNAEEVVLAGTHRAIVKPPVGTV